MNALNRFFRRLLPTDDENDDRPGAFGIHFTGKLFWFLLEAAKKHDDIDERINRGETEFTHEENDRKFAEAVKKEILLLADSMTPSQKRWALIVGGWSWPAIRVVRVLRGEK